MRVVVLGGGISGTVTAYFLARDGHDVTLIERRAGVSLESSFANGGIVCPSMSEPWSAPGAAISILRWLGQNDAPLLLRLHALPGFWRWGLMFIRNCARERYLRNARTNLRLALYSLQVFQRLRSELDIKYDLQQLGSLKLFSDRRALTPCAGGERSARRSRPRLSRGRSGGLRGDRASAGVSGANACRRHPLSP